MSLEPELKNEREHELLYNAARDDVEHAYCKCGHWGMSATDTGAALFGYLDHLREQP